MEPYVDLDQDLLTCDDLTDEDIIDDLIMARNTLEEEDAGADDGSDDGEPAPAPPTVTQPLEACDFLQRFFETVEGSDNSWTFSENESYHFLRSKCESRNVLALRANPFYNLQRFRSVCSAVQSGQSLCELGATISYQGNNV